MPPLLTPAYFEAPIADFVRQSPDAVLGELTRRSPYGAEDTQVTAWREEIEILQGALPGIEGHLLLEFDIPRLGSRVDAVVVAGSAIVTLEFKVGASSYDGGDMAQAWDYALDLKNFHRGSHDADVFPALVPTGAPSGHPAWRPPAPDGVRPPRRLSPAEIGPAIQQAMDLASGPAILGHMWSREPYEPTPTIIQAARALYAHHSVDAISRSDAGAKNLTDTSRAVERILDGARNTAHKSIVFITGVPGAGKTLVGLNIATRHRRSIEEDPTHAAFLSGNGPLVAVLREALIRDEVLRSKRAGTPSTKKAVGQRVKPFIQNVHHFRDAGLRSDDAPIDHVVIFDEAQRAWSQEKTARFMKARKGIENFAQSEPDFLLSYMDRHEDWAVVVCLIGGGQEIHDGEAGIAPWIDAVAERYPSWHVHISPQLTGVEYGVDGILKTLDHHPRLHRDPDLHLAVSLRSFRAEAVSHFVQAVLDLDSTTAQSFASDLAPRYPLVLTRDLARAKKWIRQQARGSESYGLVASSSAQRLKPHAIDVRARIDPVHWFLSDPSDTRSSYFLEDAATEFQVQGLELDWVCVTWDADLRMTEDGWAYRSFKGKKWQRVHKEERRRYLRNAYRVLLTRARQGMAIFVPEGSPEDQTRRPEFYDETYRFLRDAGIVELG